MKINRREALKFATAASLTPRESVVTGSTESSPVTETTLGKDSLLYHLSKFYPQVFWLPWSPDHLRFIQRIEDTILGKTTGMTAFALPRGSGTTSILYRSIIWAALHGHRRDVEVVSGTTSQNHLIETELRWNQLLLAEFDQRELAAIHQSLQGHTPFALRRSPVSKMDFSRGRAVFYDSSPNFEGYSKVLCGHLHAAILADIETARNHDLALFFGGSITNEHCVLHQILEHPKVLGERCKLVYQWPSNMELWSRYRRLYLDDYRSSESPIDLPSSRFLVDHFDEMHQGSIVGWEERYNPAKELSALHFAFNERIMIGDLAFYAEYQNSPIPEADSGYGRYRVNWPVTLKNTFGES